MSRPSAADSVEAPIVRFGVFELDYGTGRLLKNGRIVRLQPQPFKLLCLLAERPGQLVTRDEIRTALWNTDTFVDFDQGVNFAIKQVREALDDDAEHSLYVQTVPKRGYRFLAPVESTSAQEGPVFWPATDPNLHKALWANIAELRMAESRRQERQRKLLWSAIAVTAALIVSALAAVLFALR